MAAKRTGNKGKAAGISEKVIRLLEIYSLIAENKYPSVDALAARFHVSRRSIYRYLELIRTIDIIDFDEERKGYYFPQGSRLKKFVITKNDLMTLKTARDALSHLGKAFLTNFQGLMERMIASSEEGLKSSAPSIMLKTPDTVAGRKLEECLKIIPTCADEGRSIDIVYQAKGRQEKTTRTVNPYGIVMHDGLWMLVGWCHLRKEIRTFALDRIIDIKERNLYFSRPDDFSLEDHFSKAWGIIDGEETKVTIRFAKEAADYILRRESWHPSEQRKQLSNGGVELNFTVAGTTEIKKWIYSWLPHVEVVKPASLRKEIQKELAASAKAHSK